jgi:hypothetical protein
MTLASHSLTFINAVHNTAPHYAIKEGDEVILCDTRPMPEGGIGSCLAITLPLARHHEGRVIVIKDTGCHCSVNAITLQRQGGDLIEGGNTHVVLKIPSSYKKLVSNGISWWHEIG